MRVYLYFFILFFSSSLVFSSNDPAILFSDLESAPKSGWSNDEPNKGAAVSIWGYNFGSSRGSNYVTVNGVDLTSNDDYAQWGEYWPTPYYQRITFWLNDAMSDGDGTISVTINGDTSNTIPFTIRDGRIFFVREEVNDGFGSHENPFGARDADGGSGWIDNMLPGDIYYFHDGSTYVGPYNGGQSGFRIRSSEPSGTATHPIAFIAYPGEKPYFETLDINTVKSGAFSLENDYSIVSGFKVNAIHNAMTPKYDFHKVVGNDLEGMKTTQAGSGIVITGEGQWAHLGSGNKIFGNAIHGGTTGNRLDHAIYVNGCPYLEGAYIGWNYIYNNDFGRGPLVSINHQKDRCEYDSGKTVKSHFVFNNIIDCNPQGAKAIGAYSLSHDGREGDDAEPVYIYNNVILNCGVYDPSDNLNTGESSVMSHSDGFMHIYNNLVYNAARAIFSQDNNFWQDDWGGSSLINNIFVMNSDLVSDPNRNDYLRNIDFNRATVTNNIFYDIGSVGIDSSNLDQNTNLIEVDPMLVDPDNGNFNLLDGSPAINYGTTNLQFEVGPPSFAPINRDFDYLLRFGNYDLGAFEYKEPISCSIDSDCNDGLYCNGIETCQNNVCQSGAAPSCSSPHSCVNSICNEATDSCSYTTDDSVCDDGNVCTNNFCDQNNGCQLSNNDGISCDDGISCTPNDTCQGGSCQAGAPDDSLCLLAFPTCSSASCDVQNGCINFEPLSCEITDLEHYYKFNAGSGLILSDEFGSDGTITGAIWTSGRFGNALDFDGSSSSVSLGNLDIESDELTLSAWINPDSFSISDARIISKATGTSENDHYWMLSTDRVSGEDRLRFRLKDSSGSTTTLKATSGALQTGVWQHVAATYDGSTMKLFLDGVEVGSSSAASGNVAVDTSVGVTIGDNPIGSRAFDGQIDELRIYNKALSSAELLSEMTSERVFNNTSTTCTPNWSCSDWSTCSLNSQSRTCTDLNNCQDDSNKPNEVSSCNLESSSNIIFEYNFNEQPDWYVVDSSESCNGGLGTCDGDLPQGWSFLRNSENWHPDEGYLNSKPSQIINSDQFRGSSGKSWIRYHESSKSVGSSSWGDDTLLMKYFEEDYDDVYLRFYIKFDPNWEWTTAGNSKFKLIHFQHFDGPVGIESPWEYFSDGSNSPTSILAIKHSNTWGYRFTIDGRCDPQETDYYCDNNWQDDPAWVGYNGEDPFSDGNWHELEMRLKMNSDIGVSDGVMAVWLDGVEQYYANSINWRRDGSFSDIGWNLFAIGGNTYNWFSDPANQEEQWYAIDDIVVYTPLDSSSSLWDDSPRDGRLPSTYVIGPPSESNICGNNIIEGNEICDSSNLNDLTCEDLNFGPGSLSCSSDCLSYNTNSCGPTLDTESPSLVSNFTYSSLTQTSLVLSWDGAIDNVGVVGYSLFRDSVFMRNLTSLTQADSGLSPNTTYTYEVSAFDTAGNVGPLTSLEITTLEDSQDPEIVLDILSFSPVSAIYSNEISNVTLEIETNIVAQCYYSLDDLGTYTDLKALGTLFGGNGTLHQEVLTSFVNDTNYTYYIGCSDDTLEELSFTIGSPSNDQSEDNNDNSGDGNSGNNDSSSSGGGSSGGSSGGGSSSSSSSFLSSSAYIPSTCEPKYEESSWSGCLNGIQTRTITDVNGCDEDIRENRACLLDNSELENRFLNAKQIIINQTRDRVYSTDLKGSYNEIVYMESKLEESFVLVDEKSGEEYLGRLIEEDENKFYYSLERIDQSLLETLKDEGLIETTLGEDVNNLTDSIAQHQSFKTVLFVLGILVFVTVVLIFRFYVKKESKNTTFDNFPKK